MDEPTLQDYIAVLRRRRRVVLGAVAGAITATIALSFLQTPKYRAESELLLRGTTSESILVEDAGVVRSPDDSARELNNEIRRIESSATRDAVAEAYDGPLDVDAVHASAPASSDNDVIKIELTSERAEEAVELVNLYAETYVDVRRDTQIDDLLAASEEIQSRLDSLRERIRTVSEPLDEVNARVAAAPAGSPERTELEDERQVVTMQVLPELAPLQSRESSFRAQLEQLEATQDLSTTGGVTILAPADEPSTPVSPRPVPYLVVGALIGVLGGIALAYLVDRLDDSVGSKEESEKITALPTLGMIPKVADHSPATELATVADSASPAAEAYRLLRTSVKFLGIESPLRTVLVTSAAASEGKTITAANLAAVIAQSGDSVLLIGADLRRPRIHDVFGAPQGPGLTTVLLDESDAESTVFGVAEVPGLNVMPPGPTPPNPAELLDSQPARDLFASLADRYDTVLIDSPPVLPVTDAQVLARIADAVLVVVAYRETSRRGLSRAMELLGQVAAPVVGTVLNLVPPKDSYGGQTYRYETYRSRSERRRRREEAPKSGPVKAPPKHVAGNGASRQDDADRPRSDLAPQHEADGFGAQSAPSRDLQQ
jgi:capsular exopolysaccharide synthesis family protein